MPSPIPSLAILSVCTSAPASPAPAPLSRLRLRNDPERGRSCQARLSHLFRSLSVALALASGSAACTYTPETTVTIRDPSAVRIEVDDGKGLRTLLPESKDHAPEENDVAVPDSSPPFEQGLRTPTTLHRAPKGVIEIRCPECDPADKTLVPLDGTMTLGRAFHVNKFDFALPEMRIHFLDGREGRFGNPSVYEADVVTPWTNVALIRRVATPDRSLGVKLLLSAAIAAVLGGLSLGDGVGDKHPAATVFGAILLPLAAVLGASGSWYSFAPADEHILFRGR